MNIDVLLRHHGLTQHPFDAEEAQHDPVFERMIEGGCPHPDLPKILGRIDHPSTSVVFGEKGAGKTAISLHIDQHVAQHNQDHPDRRTLLVRYDDLNPVLDRIAKQVRKKLGRKSARTTPEQILENVRLEDHQDGIMSIAITRLVDSLLDEHPTGDRPLALPDSLPKAIKSMPRTDRVDLAVLAALYDQPRTSAIEQRFDRLRKLLRVGRRGQMSAMRFGAAAMSIVALAGILMHFMVAFFTNPIVWLLPIAAVIGAGALMLWGLWIQRHLTLWRVSNRVVREMPAIDRKAGELRRMLAKLPQRDITHQPWPSDAQSTRTGLSGREARYQLWSRLINAIGAFGYVGIMVLVDRVDEPTMIIGQADRMKPVVWPLLDNKFLQQKHTGFKLLLPADLRPLLFRESSGFFQEARLDKQNFIERLTWSGAMLYDLCNKRLRACHTPPPTFSPALPDASRESGTTSTTAQTNTSVGSEPPPPPLTPAATPASNPPKPMSLTDLFEPDVTREMIVDALDQMQQPRDAFKFLYAVVQEHCRIVPEDEAKYHIPRLVLDAIRRQQSQRVQELSRGLSPA